MLLTINKALSQEYINLTINSLDELEKYESKFITKVFTNSEADVVYKLKNKNIFFLIEHQSKIDYSMPYRILSYTSSILNSAIDKKKLKNKSYKLPLVISIVLYSGNKPWDAKRSLNDCLITFRRLFLFRFIKISFS